MTQQERSVKSYKNRKENGLCPRCGKPLDRKGHYCSECLEKIRIYHRENKDFYRKYHICTECGKVRVPQDERICPECRAKKNSKRKPLSDEKKKEYGDRFKKQQKSLYQQRKEQGICTKCGKRKAMAGKTKCGICLEKDAEFHRIAHFGRPNIKEYRREHHLCYHCGAKIDLDSGQLCSSCLERCRQNGFKSGGKNNFWKQGNAIIFMNRSKA